MCTTNAIECDDWQKLHLNWNLTCYSRYTGIRVCNKHGLMCLVFAESVKNVDYFWKTIWSFEILLGKLVSHYLEIVSRFTDLWGLGVNCIQFIVRRAGLLWSQRDFEWRWSVPLFKCLTVLEFSFILFDLCLLITFFNFIMNYVPIVTFWIFTYHKIWILSIMFCSIWSYWIIYFLACLEVSWRVVS